MTTLNSFNPEFFLQEPSLLEMFEFPWMLLAGQLSLSGPGNKLSWPDLEGSVVSVAYADNADVVYGAMANHTYEITVADFRATGFYVTDIERTQNVATAVANGSTQANRQQLINLTNVIKAAYRNSARLKATGLDAPIHGASDGLDQNLFDITLLAQGVAAVAGKAQWNTPEGRLALLQVIREARNFGRRHGWPSRFACVVPLEVYEQINALLTEDKVNLGAGSIVDSAFTTGMVPVIYGCEFFEDTLAAPITVTAAVAVGANLRMDFLYPTQSVKYITQPIAAESFRNQEKFRQDVRTLYLNGGGQDAARFLTSTTIVLTAT